MSETFQHFLNVCQWTENTFRIVGDTVTQLDGQPELSVDFGSRTFSVGDELNKLTCCVSSLTLSNIGWNGNRRPMHRGDQTKPLLRGELGCQQIDFFGQCIPFCQTCRSL